MQLRLPEDDQEDILYQPAMTSEPLSVREQQSEGETGNSGFLWYLIVGGLVLVVVILLSSSHQKIRIVYTSPRESKEAKRAGSTAKESRQQYSVKQSAARQQQERSAFEKALKSNEEKGPQADQIRSAGFQQQQLVRQPARMNAEQSTEERGLKQQPIEQSEKESTLQQNGVEQAENKKTETPRVNHEQAIKGTQAEYQREAKGENAETDRTSQPSIEQSKEAESLQAPSKETKPANQQPKAKESIDSAKNELSAEKRQEAGQQAKAPLVQQPQPQPQIPKKLAVPRKQPESVLVEQDPKLMSAPRRGGFTVPRLLWTFSEGVQGEFFFVKKCLEAMRRRAAESHFEVTVLSSKNYKSFLQPATADRVEGTLRLLEQRKAKQPQSNLKDHFEDIRRRLVVFHILNEKGGVFLEKNVLVTESFEWLSEIEDNAYVNKGSDKANAKYFGFFDMDHSSHHEKHNKSGVAHQTEKYMVLFPTVEPYFLAAQANQAFLTETMTEYVELLVNPASLPDKMKKYNLWMEVLRGKDLYYEAFYTSQLIVLHRRQEGINGSGRNRLDDTFAIDQYGLMTMNERYFPRKLAFFFSSYSEEKIYKNVAKYNLADMEATTGPMRYMTGLPLEKPIDELLRRAKERAEKYFINPESFFGRHLIANSSEPYVLRDSERSSVNASGKPWDRLPRLIWLYWDSGIRNAKVANKLCFDNIRRAAALNGFEIREINDSNTADYLGPELSRKINGYLENKKIKINPQAKSDFIRLGIMLRYGGIYMDVSYFSIKGLEWIVNITQAPSESIFNRYGEMPRAFMFFHPHYGTAFDWTYDKEANTKKLMVSAYENSLLAAEPNHQLFIDWLQQFGRFITSPYEETERLMKDLGTWEYRWTNSIDMYLAAMDSIKNVVAKRNKDILKKINHDQDYKGPKSAAQSYGIWSVSGYREQQKFRPYTNLDFTTNQNYNDKNIYLWRYSEEYVQGLIGEIKHLVKLYHWNVVEFDNFLSENYDANFSDLHPQSFAARYLYRPPLHRLSKRDGRLALELAQP